MGAAEQLALLEEEAPRPKPVASPEYTLLLGDCLEQMATLPDASVDLVLTDPPYFKVKADSWDWQWKKAGAFLEWLGRCADEWRRVLKPNGSLYCFASPQMASRVETMLSERLTVLNHIVWAKPSGWQKKCRKESLRSYFPSSERVLFCEHHGADNTARGEAGYAAKCDELRGFVFEPLRAYLDGERERAGFTRSDVNKALGTQMAGHYFSRSQWTLPTERWYQRMREVFNRDGGEFLRREYEDLRREYEDLRREYEDLRREYEDLRRPFSVTADVPFTDVWSFAPVQRYPGKHPCEKPQDLLRHAITASTRPGAVVLDSFMGTASTGLASLAEGRRFVGIERNPEYFAQAERRMERAALLREQLERP